MAQVLSEIHGRWHQQFHGVKFSTKDFYELVVKYVRAYEMPKVGYSIQRFRVSHFLSNEREYLRISRHEFGFDICAAPFGNGFFVSYWFGTTYDWFSWIPFLRKKKKYKSYYYLDTENMFIESVKECVMQAVNDMTEGKGVRVYPSHDEVVVDAGN